jgi:hypothetical protein
MNVCEERDAQSVEGRKKSGHWQCGFRHPNAMTLVRHTVRDGAGEPADGGGEHAFEGGSASDEHVSGYSSG